MLKKIWKNFKDKLRGVSSKKGAYYNPIENKLHVSEGGFISYRGGEKEVVPIKNEISTKLESVVLLNTDQEISQSISSNELAKNIQRVESIFLELFKHAKKPGKILVQFELLPMDMENDIRFAVRDDIDLEIMAEFEKRIKAEKFPDSKNSPIKFHMKFKVNSLDEEF